MSYSSEIANLGHVNICCVSITLVRLDCLQLVDLQNFLVYTHALLPQHFPHLLIYLAIRTSATMPGLEYTSQLSVEVLSKYSRLRLAPSTRLLLHSHEDVPTYLFTPLNLFGRQV